MERGGGKTEREKEEMRNGGSYPWAEEGRGKGFHPCHLIFYGWLRAPQGATSTTLNSLTG